MAFLHILMPRLSSIEGMDETLRLASTRSVRKQLPRLRIFRQNNSVNWTDSLRFTNALPPTQTVHFGTA